MSRTIFILTNICSFFLYKILIVSIILTDFHFLMRFSKLFNTIRYRILCHSNEFTNRWPNWNERPIGPMMMMISDNCIFFNVFLLHFYFLINYLCVDESSKWFVSLYVRKKNVCTYNHCSVRSNSKWMDILQLKLSWVFFLLTFYFYLFIFFIFHKLPAWLWYSIVLIYFLLAM